MNSKKKYIDAVVIVIMALSTIMIDLLVCDRIIENSGIYKTYDNYCNIFFMNPKIFQTGYVDKTNVSIYFIPFFRWWSCFSLSTVNVLRMDKNTWGNHLCRRGSFKNFFWAITKKCRLIIIGYNILLFILFYCNSVHYADNKRPIMTLAQFIKEALFVLCLMKIAFIIYRKSEKSLAYVLILILMLLILVVDISIDWITVVVYSENTIDQMLSVGMIIIFGIWTFCGACKSVMRNEVI